MTVSVARLPTPSAPPPVFPFAALTAQPELRLALVLAALDPALGGVLIEGPRGTAKSTAARALAELLPGSAFVNLPLGASLEHVVGTLDLEAALAGHDLRFSPGLLARADGGVLYVDEVNLLPDDLVDMLLDAASSGRHTVERDGISHTHAARFTLIGTMNPEEGELRPQLLDRFGLCVRVAEVTDPAERKAIVRERLRFDADPQGFRTRYAAAQATLVTRLDAARQRLREAPADVPDVVADAVTAACLDAGVEGLRADLAICRAARALAAWEEAADVGATHVERVRGLVLRHRERSPFTPAPATTGRESPPQSPTASGPPADASAGRPDDLSDVDWGALPPEPVGVRRVKLVRPWPLPEPSQPKKA